MIYTVFIFMCYTYITMTLSNANGDICSVFIFFTDRHELCCFPKLICGAVPKDDSGSFSKT